MLSFGDTYKHLGDGDGGGGGDSLKVVVRFLYFGGGDFGDGNRGESGDIGDDSSKVVVIFLYFGVVGGGYRGVW